jgi:HAD superfamily hydrolase (TIGR01549 family)
MRISAILFDLDGVLIDSFYSWFLAFNKTIEEFGLRKIDIEEFKRRYWGFELSKNLERLGLGEDAMRYCISRHHDFIGEIDLFPETKDVLKRIKIAKCLVTNAPAEDAYGILRYFDLERYFDAIVTRDDVREGKPDPEIIIRACELLDLYPGDVVLIGDTDNDVLAGRSAGCTVVGLNVNGDVNIKSLSDLYLVLEECI